MITRAKNKAQKRRDRNKMLKRRYRQAPNTGRAITKEQVFGKPDPDED